MIRSLNLLFILAVPHHFASLANQPGVWRMHDVKDLRRFLRPLPIHQPTPQTDMTANRTMG